MRKSTVFIVNFTVLWGQHAPKYPESYGLTVKYYNNRFYILDLFGSRALYAFDNEGSFISKTLTGRGPGELINPSAFDVDEERGVIQLYDQRLASMFTLDPDLKILSSFKLDSIRITDFRLLENGKVLVYHNVPTGKVSSNTQLREYYQYTLYEDNFSVFSRLGITVYSTNPPLTLPIPFCSQENIFFVVPRDYNIYELKNNLVKTAYTFDFGKFGYTRGELERLSDDEKENLEANGERTAGIGILNKSDQYLMTIISYLEQPVTFLYSLSTGLTYNLNQCFDLNLLPACYTQLSIGHDRFLAFVEPASLKEFIEVNQEYSSLDVSETDNPWLIIYSISEKI